jgi:polyhydroxybutyrate depolymerase
MLRLLCCLALSLPVLLREAAPAGADTIKVDGRQREYLLRLPSGAWPAPLLMVLHGGGGRATQLERHIDLTEAALAAGYAVVYPQGFVKHWNDGRLDVEADAVKENVDDVKFLLALVDRLVKAGQADASRVYVAGISNGAMMTLRLACEAADRLAGIVTVVGSLGVETAETCKPARPLPILMLNGTADPLVPYEGGPVAVLDDERGAVIPVEQTLALFAKANGCGAAAVEAVDDPAPRDDIAVEKLAYRDCAAPTALVRYVGGGHGWPGAGQYLGERLIGKVPEGPAANDLLLSFLGSLQKP